MKSSTLSQVTADVQDARVQRPSVYPTLREVAEQPPFETRLNPNEIVVGECSEACHPTLYGRVLVRWDALGASLERWLPTLHAMPVRAGDRVLLAQPSNWSEPVVTGVLDGFAQRPSVARSEAARITLEPDETVRVASADGTPLLEVYRSEAGPTVRLLSDDIHLDLPGALRIEAKSVQLIARQGGLRLSATDDVVLSGETINFN